MPDEKEMTGWPGRGALDPGVAWVLEKAASTGLPPMTDLSPPEARAQYKESVKPLDVAMAPMDSVTDRAIGTESSYVQVRLYVPAQTGVADPLLVFLHGGGWTIGDLDTHDRTCRYIAAQAGCRVLSVDYALAPENPFPAAVQDVVRVWRALAENPADFGADPARLAVGGDSAGGNLAAVLVHMARAEGLPLPSFQLLVYPSTDLVTDYPSRSENAEGFLLTRELTNWFVGHYIADEAARSDPRASPLNFADFEGLPPAHIQTAGYDPIRDEGTAYAGRLRAAGVPVDHRHYDGLVHGYLHLAGYIEPAKSALNDAVAALRRAFQD